MCQIIMCTRKQSADIEHVQKVTVNIILSDANTGFWKFSYNMDWIIFDHQPLEERLEKLCRTFADKTLKSRHTNMFTTFSLDGLTPRRSHVRRGDHMYPRAITSCPGHNLCLTWQVKCTCSGDHIRAWCQELQYHAKHFNSRHQARMWSPLHVHLNCQVRHRACPGQDVIARG